MTWGCSWGGVHVPRGAAATPSGDRRTMVAEIIAHSHPGFCRAHPATTPSSGRERPRLFVLAGPVKGGEQAGGHGRTDDVGRQGPRVRRSGVVVGDPLH